MKDLYNEDAIIDLLGEGSDESADFAHSLAFDVIWDLLASGHMSSDDLLDTIIGCDSAEEFGKKAQDRHYFESELGQHLYKQYVDGGIKVGDSIKCYRFHGDMEESEVSWQKVVGMVEIENTGEWETHHYEDVKFPYTYYRVELEDGSHTIANEVNYCATDDGCWEMIDQYNPSTGLSNHIIRC